MHFKRSLGCGLLAQVYQKGRLANCCQPSVEAFKPNREDLVLSSIGCTVSGQDHFDVEIRGGGGKGRKSH